MRQQVSIALAFDYAVPGKKDDNHIVRLDRTWQGRAERAANRRHRRRLIGQQSELTRRKTAAVRTAQEGGKIFSVAMRKLELSFRRQVLVTGHADHHRPQFATPVERGAAAHILDQHFSTLSLPIGAFWRGTLGRRVSI